MANKVGNAFVNVGLAVFALLSLVTVYVMAASQPMVIQGPGALKFTATITPGEKLSVTRVLNPEPAGCTVIVRRYLAPLTDMADRTYLPEVHRSTSLGRERTVRTFETVVPDLKPGEYIYVAVEEQTCSVLKLWHRSVVVEYETFIMTVVPK